MAAGAVLLFHLFPARFYYLWMGVDFFFVLSGYLITGIILNGHDRPHFVREFVLRRTLRIWPIYYLAITVALALALTSRLLPPLEGLPYALTFTTDLPLYWTDTRPLFTLRMGHLWTIAIEEQFYLLWPALFLCAAQRSTVVCVGALLIAVSVLLRSRGFEPVLLLTRADGLVLGAWLAMLTSRGPAVGRYFTGRTRVCIGATAVACLTYLGVGSALLGRNFLQSVPLWPGATILVVNLLALSVVAGIAALAGHRGLAPLRWKPLVLGGTVSYGLYLYHPLAFWVVDGLASRGGLESSPLIPVGKLALTTAAAVASWRYVEAPVLALRLRLTAQLEAFPARHRAWFLRSSASAAYSASAQDVRGAESGPASPKEAIMPPQRLIRRSARLL